MKRSIATLTIALLIGAGTEAEAQSGMTVETVYLYLNGEDFTLEEFSLDEEDEVDYSHTATFAVPEITRAVWEQGTVIVQPCKQERTEGWASKSTLDLLSGRPYESNMEEKISVCALITKEDISYNYSEGGLSVYITGEGMNSAQKARNNLFIMLIANPVLRVTIIAPAE